jgi:hypothetical protein
MLSWASSPPGTSLTCLARRFTPSNSRGLCRPNLSPAEADKSSETAALRSIPTHELHRSLSRPDAPPEVSHLVTLLADSRASPARAHDFASGPEPRHRAPSNPLWAFIRYPTEAWQRRDVNPCSLLTAAEQPRVGVAKHQQLLFGLLISDTIMELSRIRAGRFGLRALIN